MAILYLFSAFLLAPKIDLIGFGGSSLRAEDFIWVAAIFVWIFAPTKSSRPEPPRFFGYFFAYLLVSSISYAINFREAGIGGVFYILRQAQYCTWGLMALSVSRDISKENVSRHFQIVGALLAVWGFLEFAGLIPKVGKFSSVAGRLSINTSGPFETSVVLLILAFAAKKVALKGALFILMLLTQARVTILGCVVAVTAARPRLVVPLGIAFCVALIVMPVAKSALSGTRFSETDSPATMIETMAFMWEASPTFATRREFLVGAGYVDKENSAYIKYLYALRGEMSFQIRAQRWSFIVKTLLQNPLQMLVGYSPGYFGQGVDSNVVRILGESGLFGCIAFGAFLANLLRMPKNSLTWPTVIAMMITSIFIDIFWSSKAMSLLWFIATWEFSNGRSLAAPLAGPLGVRRLPFIRRQPAS